MTDICGSDNIAVGNAESDIVAVQQAPSRDYGGGPLGNGANFANCGNSTATTGSMFGSNFRSPRSYQMNIGVQRELRPGTVLSVDYLRNVDVHIAEGIDENHVGDARFLDTATAINAINATNEGFDCRTVTQASIAQSQLERRSAIMRKMGWRAAPMPPAA